MFTRNKAQNTALKNAENMLRLAQKVIDYRQDVLAQSALDAIEADAHKVSELIKDKEADAQAIDDACETLHKTLKPHGGTIYPVTFISDNVEMFLVATILAIGIRTFFFQPFKIPTNSMYPTYNGMTTEVYESTEERPGLAKRIFRTATLGSQHFNLIAPEDGPLYVQFYDTREEAISNNSQYVYENVTGTKFFVWPTKKKQYTFKVGDAPVALTVPFEFDFNRLLEKEIRPDLIPTGTPGIARSTRVYKKGEQVLSFDILTGDMLFVDRISYNFVKPKVGAPFVFRTKNIEGLRDSNGTPDDKYYIKRLVGGPGDTLQINGSTLLRNGEANTGADAFALNANQEGEYEGYLANGWLSDGLVESIPENYYFAMGDNSDQSHDSRTWAHPQSNNYNSKAKSDKLTLGKPVNMVPEKEVVGRAIFIFYPFSHRWGVAQ